LGFLYHLFSYQVNKLIAKAVAAKTATIGFYPVKSSKNEALLLFLRAVLWHSNRKA